MPFSLFQRRHSQHGTQYNGQLEGQQQQATEESTSQSSSSLQQFPHHAQDRSRLGDIEAINLEITVLQGADLTPKDRAFFGLGKLTSSDPYVKVFLVQEVPAPAATVTEDSLSVSVNQHPRTPDSSRDQFHDNRTRRIRRRGRQPQRPPRSPSPSPARSAISQLTNPQELPDSSVSHQSQSSSQDQSDDQPQFALHKVKLGRTKTIYKTLHPVWNQTIVGSLRGQKSLQHHTIDNPAYLEFHVLDEDQLSKSDSMGMVKVTLPVAPHNLETVEWYDIPPDSAKNARGRLQIQIKTTIQRKHILVRGNTFDLSANALAAQQQPQQVIQLGLSWDLLPNKRQQAKTPRRQTSSPYSPTSQTSAFRQQPVSPYTPSSYFTQEEKKEEISAAYNISGDSFVTGFDEVVTNPLPIRHPLERAVDLDASCVAISHDGHIIMPDTVYYGNLSNSNGSVTHSGDEQEGKLEGDDESITLQLHKIPNHVLAMYLVLTVASPHMTLADVQSTRVRVRDITPFNQYDYRKKTRSVKRGLGHKTQSFYPEQTLCEFTPSRHASSGDATAMFLVRIARDPSAIVPPAKISKKWILTPIQDTHPTARDFGCLLPHIKSYTRDLVPNIQIDPSERVAILSKGGRIRVQDYCPAQKLPSRVTFGLAWDVTEGENIDLDASAICLDSNLQLVDMVWWKKLHSDDYNIIHHGDEREGDHVGDDELIDLYLNNLSIMMEHPIQSKDCKNIQYIGFVINSYSGQKLKDVARASCHLFDPETNIEMATYALTNAKALEGVTALLVGCLYRAQLSSTSPTNANSQASAANGEWCLQIIAEPSMGRTVKSVVQQFQDYLRIHPPQPARTIYGGSKASTSTTDTADSENVEAEMPPFVPLATASKEDFE